LETFVPRRAGSILPPSLLGPFAFFLSVLFSLLSCMFGLLPFRFDTILL
jgi:hypothetical protein